MVVDVSQSAARSHARFNGICPTLTPNSVTVVERANRIVMPIENCCYMGFRSIGCRYLGPQAALC